MGIGRRRASRNRGTPCLRFCSPKRVTSGWGTQDRQPIITLINERTCPLRLKAGIPRRRDRTPWDSHRLPREVQGSSPPFSSVLTGRNRVTGPVQPSHFVAGYFRGALRDREFENAPGREGGDGADCQSAGGTMWTGVDGGLATGGIAGGESARRGRPLGADLGRNSGACSRWRARGGGRGRPPLHPRRVRSPVS